MAQGYACRGMGKKIAHAPFSSILDALPATRQPVCAHGAVWQRVVGHQVVDAVRWLATGCNGRALANEWGGQQGMTGNRRSGGRQMGTPSCWPATQDDRQWLDAGQRAKTAMPSKRIKTPSVRFFRRGRQFVRAGIQKRSSGRFRSFWTCPATLPLPSRAHSGTTPSCWWPATVDGWPTPKPASRPLGSTPLVACNGYLPAVAQVGEQTVGDGLLADGCCSLRGCEKKKKKKKKKKRGGGGACADADDLGAGAILRKTRDFPPSPPAPP